MTVWGECEREGMHVPKGVCMSVWCIASYRVGCVRRVDGIEREGYGIRSFVKGGVGQEDYKIII